MTLQLGGVETKRPQVVVWNPDVQEEGADARTRISNLKRCGFSVRCKERGEVTLDPPIRGENIGLFRILSDNGDDRVVWDRRIKEQVKEAFAKFRALLKKGYTAYAVHRDGSRGHKITEFDPGLQEIILGAGEAILVPKTAPG